MTQIGSDNEEAHPFRCWEVLRQGLFHGQCFSSTVITQGGQVSPCPYSDIYNPGSTHWLGPLVVIGWVPEMTVEHSSLFIFNERESSWVLHSRIPDQNSPCSPLAPNGFPLPIPKKTHGKRIEMLFHHSGPLLKPRWYQVPGRPMTAQGSGGQQVKTRHLRKDKRMKRVQDRQCLLINTTGTKCPPAG